MKIASKTPKEKGLQFNTGHVMPRLTLREKTAFEKLNKCVFKEKNLILFFKKKLLHYFP